MTWLAPLAVLIASMIYWRWQAISFRRWYLFIGTLVLTGLLTWLVVPGLEEHPLTRFAVVLGFWLATVTLIALVAWSARRGQRRWIGASILVVMALFIVTRWPAAWDVLQRPFLTLIDQPASFRLPPTAWLGLSYVLFRLLHILLDARRNQLPDLDLRSAVIYALFPPSLIAGPIDRWPRFKTDLDRFGSAFEFRFVGSGAWRILIGAFKKFVLAGFLAKLPLDLTQYPDRTPFPVLWLALYGYGLLLYFDFSGYTDMALGVAQLFGFTLPDNFDAPYLKTNLARFWQSWHMTLSSWARDYVFLPLARTLRLKADWLPPNGAALISHLVTMLVIGLWHGFAWTFVVWGLWHGVGLFVVKVWGDFARARHIRRTRWMTASGWLITFNFVMLGWVFFGAPDLPIALSNLGKLIGVKF